MTVQTTQTEFGGAAMESLRRRLAAALDGQSRFGVLLEETRDLLEHADSERRRAERERDDARKQRNAMAADARRLQETAKSWEAIAAIYDQFVDGDLTPYDAIQAVGEQVGDR